MKKLLIIGHTFPEPDTTAAGSRMMQLIELFLSENYQITFASTAVISEKAVNFESKNISIENILLNDSSFDLFAKQLNPEIVIFDRYITEEQFGWRISETCPNALKILDTEDLHFLRKAREEAIKKRNSISEVNLFSETAKRELASILRCDISLIISEFEMELLQKIFRIPSNILYYLPFLLKASSANEILPSFAERKNFITIGNLLHQPNVDSVLQLKKLWREIKKQLPKSELHIYGAYASQQIIQLHNVKEGFLIKGWTQDLEKPMKNARVQLAPIRFGAGLKGKLIEAMQFGTPSVTTTLGAEGLCGNLPFSGSITISDEEFIKAAIQLYTDENKWNFSQRNGFDIIEKRFKSSLFSTDFITNIYNFLSNLKLHRQHNFIGQILQHHTLQSTKYLSKWIEAKNTLPQNASPVCYANTDEVRDEYK